MNTHLALFDFTSSACSRNVRPNIRPERLTYSRPQSPRQSPFIRNGDELAAHPGKCSSMASLSTRGETSSLSVITTTAFRARSS